MRLLRRVPAITVAAVAVTAMLAVPVLAATIGGTPGEDNLTGTLRADTIRARVGNDVVHARAGADRVFGGLGRDTLYGQAGDDRLFGQGHKDLIYGGFGDDVLHGGPGNDTIRGGPGQDEIYAGGGNDVVFSDGADSIHLGPGADYAEFEGLVPRRGLFLLGGLGNDEVANRGGSILARLEDGDDTYWGGKVTSGNDAQYVRLGRGSDEVLGGIGHASLHGGPGRDFILWGIWDGQPCQGDECDHNVGISGGANADRLEGFGTDLHISGGPGADVITSHGGYVSAGPGNDTVYAEGAIVYCGDGYDTLYGSVESFDCEVVHEGGW